MNYFEKVFTLDLQKELRRKYAGEQVALAQKEIERAERFERQGNHEIASLIRGGLQYYAKRKEQWLNGKYFEKFGTTLFYFLPVMDDCSPLVADIVEQMLDNLDKESTTGSRNILETDVKLMQFYAINRCKCFGEFATEISVLGSVSETIKLEGLPVTPDTTRDITNRDVKKAWNVILQGFCYYKQWEAEKEA